MRDNKRKHFIFKKQKKDRKIPEKCIEKDEKKEH